MLDETHYSEFGANGSPPEDDDSGSGFYVHEIDESFEVDKPRIERAVREILIAIGENPDREGLIETPARVARMYAELFRGLNQQPAKHLKKFFTEKYDSMVIVRDIDFNSMCEHHLLPFTGKVHIGYIPDGRVVGLSKLARVVETVARRPQLQERMTETIASLLKDERSARRRSSSKRRTVHDDSRRQKPDAYCVTSAMKGTFRTDARTRAEFLNLALKK